MSLEEPAKKYTSTAPVVQTLPVSASAAKKTAPAVQTAQTSSSAPRRKCFLLCETLRILVLSTVIVTVFLLSGAFVFNHYEGAFEESVRRENAWLHWRLNQQHEDAQWEQANPDRFAAGEMREWAMDPTGVDAQMQAQGSAPAMPPGQMPGGMGGTGGMTGGMTGSDSGMGDEGVTGDGDGMSGTGDMTGGGEGMTVPSDGTIPALDAPTMIDAATNALDLRSESFRVWTEAQSRTGLDAESEPHWDFNGSLFFTLTVITTIGYGVTAPQTEEGRVFLIIYGLLSIALVGFVLSNVSDVVIR
jgi:hypothetical protein